METREIHQEVEFDASPAKIYELLMDSKKHSGFSGSKCEISKDVGGKFNCYDGYIDGENVKLEPNKKIIQKWRGKDFPEGYFSTVVFELENDKGKTKLKFTHKGVPKDAAPHIETGWKTQYWDKMKKFLKNS